MELTDREQDPPPPVVRLSNADKAAVIVRLLVSEGAMPRLTGLSLRQQEALVRRMAALGAVDRRTLAAVAHEFAQRLDGMGLTFPGSVAGALDMVREHLSEEARERLTDLAEADGPPDPWRRIAAADPDRLNPILVRESAEVCAILLSKLPVAKAAALLAELPADRARVVAHAVALTAAIGDETIARVGASLLDQMQAQPVPAFSAPPADRVGAILNAAAAATRDGVLEGLETHDAEFADHVRKAIFTFDHIPKRVEPTDVPKVMRQVDAATTVTALAAGMQAAPVAVEFLLENMSKRMAEQLRDDAEARGQVRGPEGEVAMAEVVTVIRSLADGGEIKLIAQED
ncbi:flagellar motor switch protein FliG [Rhodobacteraceae bacterium W635]|uniref:FliG C-terminal domain-containing protein n=1 Tax=Nioella halotolerans TaxID=2303578 RepID=UPI000E3DCBCE|nr:flagellar motor switch protein FliG [Rhodobacteraceae bacterium W635]